MKQALLRNLKNIPGWHTRRKLVILSVDDYGNVRLDSSKARENMDQAGLKVHSRFDAYDALENKQDLAGLYEVLTSVKDNYGRNAVFSPYALPCNINFEKVAEQGYNHYYYEKLPETYQKLAAKDPVAYEGAWELWGEGISKSLMAPQFHGREHLNIKVFESKLAQNDHEVVTALKNRSYTSISHSGFPNIGYTAAFAFENEDDQKAFPEILQTGIQAFEEVYGYPPKIFTPPAQKFPKSMEENLSKYGIKALDKPFIHKIHQGGGKYNWEMNFSGKSKKTGLNKLVRNVVFEPNNGKKDHVGLALRQIEAAFYWGKPANISSHRVNFCGHIQQGNRKNGLSQLQELLQKIVKRWPDVEFITTKELCNLVE